MSESESNLFRLLLFAVVVVDDDVVVVNPLTPQKEAAYLVAKYNLMAVPVIDPDNNAMLGIVTVDDAIDTMLPTAWKKKLPRFSGR